MSKLKIDCISDLHLFHPKLEGGDILLCAGDLTFHGKIHKVIEMLKWLSEQDYKHIVYIAGNHDKTFDFFPEAVKHIQDGFPNLTYLNDNGTECEGLKIWGSPITPAFGSGWAFNRYAHEIGDHWKLIPNDIDILITHGPPYGILDKVAHSYGRDPHVGCPKLLEKVQKIKPKVHLFGHIHEAYGQIEQDGITYVNASIMNLRYDQRHPNKVITLNL